MLFCCVFLVFCLAMCIPCSLHGTLSLVFAREYHRIIFGTQPQLAFRVSFFCASAACISAESSPACICWSPSTFCKVCYARCARLQECALDSSFVLSHLCLSAREGGGHYYPMLLSILSITYCYCFLFSYSPPPDGRTVSRSSWSFGFWSER